MAQVTTTYLGVPDQLSLDQGKTFLRPGDKVTLDEAQIESLRTYNVFFEGYTPQPGDPLYVPSTAAAEEGGGGMLTPEQAKALREQREALEKEQARAQREAQKEK